MDAFLAEAEAAAPFANHIATVGRLIGLAGTIFGLGGVVYAQRVARPPSDDARRVLGWAGWRPWPSPWGPGIEVIAQLGVVGGSWAQTSSFDVAGKAMLSSFGIATTLRALSGVGLYAAVTGHQLEMGRQAVALARRRADTVPVSVGAVSRRVQSPPPQHRTTDELELDLRADDDHDFDPHLDPGGTGFDDGYDLDHRPRPHPRPRPGPRRWGRSQRVRPGPGRLVR